MLKIFNKKSKGSLTVEATLVLPLVLITLLFTVNILNICMVNLCMQQSLNNTAKKISQDSYLVYRLAGKDAYKEFMNTLSKASDGYEDFKNKAEETKNSFTKLQDSVKSTVRTISSISEIFQDEEKVNDDTVKIKKEDKKSLLDKVEALSEGLKTLNVNKNDMDKSFGDFTTSVKTLYTSGKENIKAIAIKFMFDIGTSAAFTGIAEYAYNMYTGEKGLNIPASKIEELNFFHSKFNDDGSFTMVLSYLYVNPFSFVNHDSFEYSVINKKIRMVNCVTIKPFIGKDGTELSDKVSSVNNDDDSVDSTGEDGSSGSGGASSHEGGNGASGGSRG